MRRLKKGSKKYKGKLSIKCFDCRKIGHYASRSTFKEDNYRRSDDDNKRKDNYMRDDRKKRVADRDKSIRIYFSMETHSFEDEYGHDSNAKSLFLAIEEKDSERYDTSHNGNNIKNSMTEKTALHTNF